MHEYAYWLVAGLVLVAVEFVTSALLAIFLGVSALVVGALVFLGVMDNLAWELTVFALLSVLQLVFVRRYLSDRLFGRQRSREPIVDNAGLIGQRAKVVEPFVDGLGVVLYRGARWEAKCTQALKPDQTVRIVAYEGILLAVAPWSSDP